MRKNKKILFIVTRSDTIGGVQVHIIDLINHLKKDGYDCMIVAGDSKSRILFNKLKDTKINYKINPFLKRKISPINDLLSIIWTINFIKKNKFDIVHCHSSKAGVVGRLSSLMTGTKNIFTVHGLSFLAFNNIFLKNFYIFIEFILSYATNKLIFVSFNDYQIAKSKYINIQNAEIIHNSVPDFKEFRKKDRIDKKMVKIISVARFDKQKNHKMLLKAFSNLNPYLNWELNLFGDGILLNECKKLAHNLKIEDRVNFKGFVNNNEILKEYQNNDIFVLCSNWEGFPITTLEAMREGLPIIITDIGGSAEAIIDNYNGFIINNNDVKSLGTKLEKLISSEELRSEFSINSKKIFHKVFSYDVFYRKTESIIKSL